MVTQKLGSVVQLCSRTHEGLIPSRAQITHSNLVITPCNEDPYPVQCVMHWRSYGCTVLMEILLSSKPSLLYSISKRAGCVSVSKFWFS